MTEESAYQRRPEYFKYVGLTMWSDWRWQQKHSLNSTQRLTRIFPKIHPSFVEASRMWEQRGFRYSLTPYVLSLVNYDTDGNTDWTDPIWRQFFPAPKEQLCQLAKESPGEYTPSEDNWETANEMITPICQHKYDNRVIIYCSDACLGYCTSCFRSLQSNDRREKHGGPTHWSATMRAIEQRPEIEEVILSGGDPLLGDNLLETMLRDLRRIPSVQAIRIHTRAWTHNPYRINPDFCRMLKKYDVTEMSVHVNHPNELSPEFQSAVKRIRASGARTLLLGQTVLIKGVNNGTEVLRRHFVTLYRYGVKPYYLFHCMPNIPAASLRRTSVRKGAEIMKALKRHISNPAMPEYCIVHNTGKRTVPQELDGTSEFIYTTRVTDGKPVIKFLNWKGQWCEYLDGTD